MASDLERRIERLEEAAQWRTRPLSMVFDERDYDDPEAAERAYQDATPEPEQAEYTIVVNDPFAWMARCGEIPDA